MRFNGSILIHRTPEEVFRFVVSPTKMPQWNTGLKELKAVKGRRTQKDSVMNHIYIENGEVLVVREEVLIVERGREFTSELIHKNMISTIQYLFKTEGRATRLDVKVRVRLVPRFMGIFGLFMRAAMRDRLLQDLGTLKKLMEK